MGIATLTYDVWDERLLFQIISGKSLILYLLFLRRTIVNSQVHRRLARLPSKNVILEVLRSANMSTDKTCQQIRRSSLVAEEEAEC